MKPYWTNPWKDVVYVPIEELAECDYGLDKWCGQSNGPSFILTKEKILEHWRSAGDKLDAYILPCASGFHSIGIRYGEEGSEYLSPLGDKDKVAALLKKYM
jgi:hypothetical protein